ncbi:MAG: hypothetical protein LBL47_00485 [Lactobacillus sp.]|jgi:hypothetical protein|nr:hypothetical protein [Lactobacillus sp.]
MKMIEVTDPRYPEIAKLFENEAVKKTTPVDGGAEETPPSGKTKKEKRVRSVTHNRRY